MRQPPRVATMLLRRLAPPAEEALLGDLVEEYTAGRSGAWYTRQVLAAIAIGAFRGITEHKLLALRAIAIGWIALLLFFTIAGDVLAGQSRHWISNRMYYTGQRVFGADTWQVVRFVPAWFCGFFIAGTLVGRTHRVHPRSDVVRVRTVGSHRHGWCRNHGVGLPISHACAARALLRHLHGVAVRLVGRVCCARAHFYGRRVRHGDRARNTT